MRMFWHIIRFILLILGAIDLGIGLTTTVLGLEPFSRLLLSLLIWAPIIAICIYFERRYKNPPTEDDVVTRQTKVRKPLLYGFLAFISLLIIVTILSNISGAKETTEEEAAAPAVVSKYETGPPDAQEMLELVNDERAKVGVAPLTLNTDVEKSAQLKADDFVNRDYYDHIVKGTKYTLTAEMGELVFAHCSSSSENIAADMLTSQEALYASNGWIVSTPHRKAILDPQYTYTGFGVSQEDDGDYYIVERFCVAK